MKQENPKNQFQAIGKYETKETRFPAIRRWIRSHGMTVTQFASAVGVSSTAIYYMLSGTTEPSLHIVRGILTVTGMTFEEAFQEAEP